MGSGVPHGFQWDAALTAFVVLMVSGATVCGDLLSPDVQMMCPLTEDVRQTKHTVQIKAFSLLGSKSTVIVCQWEIGNSTKPGCYSNYDFSFVKLEKDYVVVKAPKSQLYKNSTYKCELVPTDVEKPTTDCSVIFPEDLSDGTPPSDGDRSKEVSSEDLSDGISKVTTPSDGDQSKEVPSETAGHDNRLLIVSIVLGVGLIFSLFFNFFLLYQLRRRATNKRRPGDEQVSQSQVSLHTPVSTPNEGPDSERSDRRPGDEQASQSQLSLHTPVSTPNEGPDNERSDRRPGDEQVSQSQVSLPTPVSTPNEGPDSERSDRRPGDEQASQSLLSLPTPVSTGNEGPDSGRSDRRPGDEQASQSQLSLPTPMSTPNEGPDSGRSDRMAFPQDSLRNQDGELHMCEQADRGSTRGRRTFSQNSSHLRKQKGKPIQLLFTRMYEETEL